MPIALGAHNPRLEPARDLLTKQGRREHRAFSFEGPTLLSEAMHSGTQIRSLFVTAQAYEQTPAAKELEARGTPVYLIDERAMRKISDVHTPSGVLAVAPLELWDATDLLRDAGVVLALADVGDPGNAGTLLRTAEAFGVDRVIFGALGVEPHHPKVVRAAMGALFRRRVAVAEPAQLSRLTCRLASYGVSGPCKPAGNPGMGSAHAPDRRPRAARPGAMGSPVREVRVDSDARAVRKPERRSRRLNCLVRSNQAPASFSIKPSSVALSRQSTRQKKSRLSCA